MRYSLDLGCRSHFLIRCQATFRVDQVGGKDRINQGRFAQAGLSCEWDVGTMKLRIIKPKKTAHDLPTHMTLNWKPRFKSFFSICDVMLSKPTWLRGKTVLCEAAETLDMVKKVSSTKGIEMRKTEEEW
jgi:hypothetical protein